MKVAICIVSYRSAADVRRCLGALERLTLPAFEVVVCENGGTAACEALRRELPAELAQGQPVRVICDPDNGGYASGMNRCMREAADADAWWILNADTQPHADSLALMFARLSRGQAHAVGCTLIEPNGRVESRGGRWVAPLARAVTLTKPHDPRLNYLSGAALLVGREFVERAGYMREDYFLYAEEVEWCVRAVRAGLNLVVEPAAIVEHAQGASTGSVLDMRRRGRMPVYLDERNKLLLTRDTKPGLLPIAVPAALALLMLRFGKRLAWRQLGYALQGWRAGLRNERGKPAWFADAAPAG